MKAVILSIGSEILQGFLTDTNSTFLAQELNALGIHVVGVSAAGDDLDRLVSTFKRALNDADIVVATGGIGPTSDDLTREAVATVCGETPEISPLILEEVRSFFRRRGAEMPERNAKQAWLIPSAESLTNPMGTAPGWFVRYQGRSIVLMPGVPREMMPMWRTEAVPRLRTGADSQIIVSQTLKTIGIGESAVEQMLRDIIERGFPVVSTYAKNDGVHVRIHAASADAELAKQAVESTEREVRAILGLSVYGDLDTSLPCAVLQPLVDVGDTLVIWEAGTGGQVSHLLMSDSNVATAVEQAHVTWLPERASKASSPALALDAARKGIASLMRNQPGCEHGLSVALRLLEQDDAGRYDAEVAIVVVRHEETFESRHTLAAREQELGRRASLLAAEFLRQVLLDPTSLRRD